MAEVANFGWLRPPLIYACSILAGALATWLWPLALAFAAAVPVGSLLVLASIILFLLSVRALRTAGTPVPGNQPTTSIVRAGPYRFSRNPIYLAFSLLHLGIAVGLDSAWLLGTLAGAMALMHFVVIRREEEYLERRFGAQYLGYKVSVRRWL